MQVLKINPSNTGSFVYQKNPSANEPQSAVAVELKQDEQNTQTKESLNEKLANIAEKLNKQMDFLDTNVRFGFNDKIDSMYIKVVEKNTGKEIRQIPTEEAMRLAEHLRDIVGMIFDKES